MTSGSESKEGHVVFVETISTRLIKMGLQSKKRTVGMYTITVRVRKSRTLEFVVYS